MYQKSAVIPCERLFSSDGYIVNKTHLSLEPNIVNLLVCFRCWLSDDIWAKKRLCYSLFLTIFTQNIFL